MNPFLVLQWLKMTYEADPDPRSDDDLVLSFFEVEAAFIALAIGILGGTAAFTLELLCYRCCRPPDRGHSALRAPRRRHPGPVPPLAALAPPPLHRHTYYGNLRAGGEGGGGGGGGGIWGWGLVHSDSDARAIDQERRIRKIVQARLQLLEQGVITRTKM